MTPEQEQLVLKMLSKLADMQLVSHDRHSYGYNLYACLFCDGEPSVFRSDFSHYHDCPVILAQQLRKTINDDK